MASAGGVDRRYQVFISSTYLDLQEERQEVIQALLELDCFPAGMELFPASNDERWDLIKSVIDDSDYYIVIVGGRYGSTDDKGVSYTEREYDYAVKTGKPIMGFLHGNPGDIPRKKLDADPNLAERLEAFRHKVGQRMCKFWTSPEDLGSVVSRSLVKLIKSSPGIGWVRADNALTPEKVEETAALRQRISELEGERERSRTSPPPGTEDLAQGQDPVTITYTFEHLAPGRPEFSAATYENSVELTWDDVFAATGPAMFDEAEEGVIGRRLAAAIHSKVLEDLRELLGEARYSDFRVSPATVDNVKVQLVALHLIEKSDKRHALTDKGTYWRLTPYGETYVMRLLARRRNETEPVSET